MLATTSSHNPIRQPSHRGRNLLLAFALASLAIAGFVLPFVWDVLAAIDNMPKMQWLQPLLSASPVLSWFMMFVWGASIPLMLLFMLHQAPAHRIRNGFVVLVLMFIAVTWYVHMPPAYRCDVLYPQAELACSALKWGFSTSLGLATAAYVFAVFVVAFSSVGFLAQSLSDKPSEANRA
ncbi:hypothetical protein [Diaphorobacter aerolatus]|uniref:Transmembrane protein n=1 Tax=Diaphorobacter aerolatus TaxID=1288495 RepID=A0A7H0GHA2_9BURK|nr:hypothetical protein [Diaphorobacter aerolatus]QNP47668.1 hypothetical protein H9K75_15795 [Diaphorobacter aerolatus]